MKNFALTLAIALLTATSAFAQIDYRVLATSKTSTMEGETAIGGKEVVVLMQKGAVNLS